MNKKILTTLLLGIFILAGTGTPCITQANPSNCNLPDFGPDLMVKRISDDFGVNSDEISKYMHQGVAPHDLIHAALLSKSSGKSITDILAMKTLANTWNDVETSLGITVEQLHALHEDMLATKMSKDLSISKEKILTVIQSGYLPPDIEMAAQLANNTPKSLADILSLKKINNSWSDVAQTLGIDKEKFIQDIKKNHMMPNLEMRGPGPGGHPFMGPENPFGELDNL